MVENRQKLYNILCYPVKKDFCSDIHHLKSIVCLSVHYHIATYHTMGIPNKSGPCAQFRTYSRPFLAFRTKSGILDLHGPTANI